jgi:hypothetical protein
MYVQTKWGSSDQLFILIKPTADAPLNHVVDVLDEMMINEVKRYAMIPISTAVDSFVLGRM